MDDSKGSNDQGKAPALASQSQPELMHRIDGVWRSVPWSVSSTQDAIDGARYRWLRDHVARMHCGLITELVLVHIDPHQEPEACSGLDKMADEHMAKFAAHVRAVASIAGDQP
jgi:hypothetical protein